MANTNRTPTADKDLSTVQLTPDQATFLCEVINRIGTGEHPTATLEQLKYFMAPYAVECLTRAMARLTPAGAAKANEIIVAINSTVNPTPTF